MGDQSMFRGDTFVLNVRVVQNQVPVDLTGAKMWFTLKRYVQDPDVRAIAQLTSDGPIDRGSVVILNQASYRGQATVTLNPLATRDMMDGPERLYFDVQVKLATGLVTTVDAGVLTVSPDVTRSF